MTQMQPYTKQNQNHGHKEEIGDCQGEGVGMEWEGRVSRCELLYTEWTNDKVLLV